MQAEGQWPSDDDYGLEDTMAQPQPPAQPVPAPLSEDE